MIKSKEIHFIDVWPIDLLKPLMTCENYEHKVSFFFFTKRKSLFNKKLKKVSSIVLKAFKQIFVFNLYYYQKNNLVKVFN